MILTRIPTGLAELDRLLDGGLPNKATILVEGDSGLGKERFSYEIAAHLVPKQWNVLFLSTRPDNEILADAEGNGIHFNGVQLIRVRETVSKLPDSNALELPNLTEFAIRVKQILKESQKASQLFLVADFLSPLLLTCGLDRAYPFLSEFLEDCKQHEGIYFFLLEKGMHDKKDLSTLERSFEGVIEFAPYEDGLTIRPLLGVKKMIGTPFPTKFIELGALKAEGTRMISSRREIAEVGYEKISACQEDLIISTYGKELWEGYNVFGPLFKKLLKKGGRVRIITNIDSANADVFQDYVENGIEVKHADEERIRRFFIVDSKQAFFSVTKPDIESKHQKLDDYEGEDAWIFTNQSRQLDALIKRFEADWCNSADGSARLDELKPKLEQHP